VELRKENLWLEVELRKEKAMPEVELLEVEEDKT
jgi:hypothetical protein